MSMLAVVILHYGNPEMTENLRDQLFESDPSQREHVFVLDNAAPQPFVNPWLRAKKNLHWAGALQFSLAEFSDLGYSHLWFLNNDIFFLTPFPIIARAWQRLKYAQKKLGRVGVYSPSVTQNPYHPQMVQIAGVQLGQVRYIDGIAPLISVDCWKELGGVDFKGNEFGYGVDVWFSMQADRLGWNVVVDHQLLIRHSYHSTAAGIDGYLKKAAVAEDIFLTKRLGKGYREEICRLGEDRKLFG